MNGHSSSSRDPTWSRILRYIYDNHGDIRYSINSPNNTSARGVSQLLNDRGIPRDHELLEDNNISPDEAMTALSFLMDFNLLSTSRTDFAGYDEEYGDQIDPQTLVFELTSKGFELAHEREMVRQQDTTNQQTAIMNQRVAELTVVLAGVAVIQTLAALFSAKYITTSFLGIGIIVTIVGVVAVYVLIR